MGITLEKQIHGAIKAKRKHLLDFLEVLFSEEKFQSVRRYILNMMGDKGLDGEVRDIFADFEKGRAGKDD
jgi:hypothetical protein